MNLSRFIARGLSEAPRPFPGKYPTRIQIVTWRGTPFLYEGKPVSEVLNLVRRQFLLKGRGLGDLYITEVDQNGVVRNLRGGTFEHQAPFADIYFPIPRFLLTGQSPIPTYAMLDRRLVVENGRSMYANTSLQNHPVLGLVFQRMLKDCARNRVGGVWFNRASQELAIDVLLDKALDWTKAPNKKASKARRTAPAREPRQNMPTLGMRAALRNEMAQQTVIDEITATWHWTTGVGNMAR